MNYRTFGRTGWKVSEMGYGMWGMAGWTGSEDRQSLESLNLAVELGELFDTAYAYGEGHSERLLGRPSSASTRGKSSIRQPRSRPRTASGPRGAGRG